MSEFVEYLSDQLDPFGPLTVKRLFGGHALCKNDLAFAIIFNDCAYFKVDDSNRADYETLDSQPFSYQKGGKTILVSNWQVPSEILDDQDELINWAEKAYQVALNTNQKKQAKKNNSAQLRR